MQGLVDHAPVLYVGSFSKTMFPSLRLGFLVLPRVLIAQVQGTLGELLRGGHRHEQLAMAHFIESGQFSRHLGRMRRLYRERQYALRKALDTYLPQSHEVLGGHAGLHLTVRLPSAYPDHQLAELAVHYGMAPAPLSAFAWEAQPHDNGLVLGYGNTASELIEPLVRRLALLMQELHST
jgi:GntR family transcriptional regulator/MocR family aminotransferase